MKSWKLYTSKSFEEIQRIIECHHVETKDVVIKSAGGKISKRKQYVGGDDGRGITISFKQI